MPEAHIRTKDYYPQYTRNYLIQNHMQEIQKENLSPNRKTGEGLHREGNASSSKCREMLNSIYRETNPGYHEPHSVSKLLAKLLKNTYLAYGIFSRGMQALVP